MRALFPAVALLALAFAAGSTAAVPGVAEIFVDYGTSCTFTLMVDPGTQITSTSAPGQTLPPGNYQLLTSMPNPSSGYPCGQPTFTLTGPGVSVSIQFAGVELHDERMIVLQLSSTYVAQEATTPDTTRRVFTTSATGSSSSLVVPLPPTGSPAGSTQSDLVGSAIAPYRGELAAAVGRSGMPTLARRGRAVTTLKAGRYAVAVDDADPHAGFFVQAGGRRALAVAGVGFVGKRTQRITLTAGTWTYFAAKDTATRFTVVP